MRYLEIFERASSEYSQVFNAAKKAYGLLSHDAKRSIDSWESANWTEGSLANHVKAGDEVAQEIEAAFAPVRALLPGRVSLVRGIVKQGQFTSWQNGNLESWTIDEEVAQVFAGLRDVGSRRSFVSDVRSEEEIDAIVAKYEATGFVRVDGKYYVRNKEHPKFYNIYSSSKNYITDGDDLKKDLSSDSDWRAKANAEYEAKAHIFREDIDRDRIVWITNNLNCKEFIVRK